MQRVLGTRYFAPALAAVLLTAGVTVAHFASTAPGSDLEPLGGAEAMIDLVQSNETILWKALDGTVTSYSVLGWPSSEGPHDLGGSLVIERPANGSAGVIETAEKPMSVAFSVED